MTPRRTPGPDERALLGLGPGEPLPSGGAPVLGVYFTGHGSSFAYLDTLQRFLGRRLVRGSLNLRAPSAFELVAPRIARIGTHEWQVAPVILGECAIGVVARRHLKYDPQFLEIFSPVLLAPALGLSKDGDLTMLRLLDGRLLRTPASQDRGPQEP